MPAGSKPGERRGGRKPGKPNNASARREKLIAETGITPLDAMIFTMRYYHDQATTLMDAATKIRRQKNEDVQAFDARRRKHQLDVENAIEGLKLSAKEAAPYIHPRLATLQSNVNLTGRLTLEALVMQSLPQPANGNATLAIEGEVGEQAQIAAE